MAPSLKTSCASDSSSLLENLFLAGNNLEGGNEALLNCGALQTTASPE
jgi:hypothetical protein